MEQTYLVEIDSSRMEQIREVSGLARWDLESQDQCVDMVIILGLATLSNMRKDNPAIDIKTVARIYYGVDQH